jgi:hypothetical protein
VATIAPRSASGVSARGHGRRRRGQAGGQLVDRRAVADQLAQGAQPEALVAAGPGPGRQPLPGQLGPPAQPAPVGQGRDPLIAQRAGGELQLGRQDAAVVGQRRRHRRGQAGLGGDPGVGQYPGQHLGGGGRRPSDQLEARRRREQRAGAPLEGAQPMHLIAGAREQEPGPAGRAPDHAGVDLVQLGDRWIAADRDRAIDVVEDEQRELTGAQAGREPREVGRGGLARGQTRPGRGHRPGQGLAGRQRIVGDHHRHPGVAQRRLDRGGQERGLADPGLAVQEAGAEPVAGDGADQLVDLGVAAGQRCALAVAIRREAAQGR